jgi:hypothetical protein
VQYSPNKYADTAQGMKYWEQLEYGDADIEIEILFTFTLTMFDSLYYWGQLNIETESTFKKQNVVLFCVYYLCKAK